MWYDVYCVCAAMHADVAMRFYNRKFDKPDGISKFCGERSLFVSTASLLAVVAVAHGRNPCTYCATDVRSGNTFTAD